MQITIVAGSHRNNSESLRVAQFLSATLTKTNTKTEILSLENNPLPLWSEDAWQANSQLSQQFQPYSEKLKAADGLIFIVPEWNGMVTPAFKNFLLFCGKKELAHKPALIVSVSSGINGAYPVSELRMSGYKNTHICYIPEHLILRYVGKLFHSENENDWDSNEAYIRKRIPYALHILLSYAKALKPMRNDDSLFHKDYPFGM